MSWLSLPVFVHVCVLQRMLLDSVLATSSEMAWRRPGRTVTGSVSPSAPSASVSPGAPRWTWTAWRRTRSPDANPPTARARVARARGAWGGRAGAEGARQGRIGSCCFLCCLLLFVGYACCTCLLLVLYVSSLALRFRSASGKLQHRLKL